ncbi:helix-turn-helix domain-containing protein [Eubacterium callanderi]|uniref:helix-turn-helix domain-containing protein n=1 Tax=Eubacterium callanderi TaxID=53442 RepID=UPI000B8861AE|nr:helix-turn-helix transcriptional regulator [Eubacterium callanderi]MBU5305489.1 helix-turn-helix domain-containing protein [Eubacterium callanderi]
MMDIENLRKIFSGNLNFWLAKRGKTQADLYKKLNVSSATASDWCNAKKIPKTDKLLDIASWLMIELSDLLYERSSKYTDFDEIVYRLKDDPDFCSLINDIACFDTVNYNKIRDYVELLKK